MQDEFTSTMTRIDEIISDIDRLRKKAQNYPGFRTFAIQKAERLIHELQSLNVYVDTLWPEPKRSIVEEAQKLFPETKVYGGRE